MKRLLAAAVAALLIGYLAAFYGTGLRNDFGQPIRDDAGRSLSRFDQLWPLLLRPDDLLPIWFGAPPQFALADRLPVLLVAAAVVLWAWAAGRLALRAIVRGTGVPVRQPARRDIPARPPATTDVPASQEASTQASGHGCLPRQTGFTRLEIFVFSAGVGLNILSTWVLLLGLRRPIEPLLAVYAAGNADLAGGRRLRLPSPCGTDCQSVLPSGADGQSAAFWPFDKLSRVAASSRPPGAGGQPGCGEEPDVVGIRWLWAALPFVLVLVLASVLPPLDFDVCEYHLQAPKEFFEQGRIGFLPHNVYANMPMGAEMLSLLAMSIAGRLVVGRAGRQAGHRGVYAVVCAGASGGGPPLLLDRRRSGRGAAVSFGPLDPERLLTGTDRRRLGLLLVLGVVCRAAVEAGRRQRRVLSSAGRLSCRRRRGHQVPRYPVCARALGSLGGRGAEKRERGNVRGQAGK